MGILQDKRFVVTGAGQGLGYAVVSALTSEGARVFATDLPDNPGLKALSERASVDVIGADLAVEDDVTSVARAARTLLGGIDGLVVCHAYMVMGRFLEQHRDIWWRHLHVNLRATFQLTQQVVPDLQEAGGGRIVIIGSEAGSVGMHEATAYSASKAGLAALVKTMARELGPQSTTVNILAPSYIDTPQLAVDAANAKISVEQIKQQAAENIPMRRVAQPAEIAKSVVYLLGPYGGATTGQVLNVNGGSFRGRA
jgi:NAD(P)-dependent dehydrogenase (short-subunit alcohol dehydrogenase family)